MGSSSSVPTEARSRSTRSRRGTIDYTISLCGFREGISAVDTLNTYFEEGAVDDRIVSEVEEFTTENAKEKRAELDQREECN